MTVIHLKRKSIKLWTSQVRPGEGHVCSGLWREGVPRLRGGIIPSFSCSKASTLRDFASLFFLLLLVYFSFFFLLRLLWWCWLTPMLSCTWLTGWHVNHHKYPKHKLPVADAQRLWRKKSVDDSSLSPFHLRNKAREKSLDLIIPV